MKIRILYFILIWVFAIHCNRKEESNKEEGLSGQLQELRDHAMHLHDSIMPLMDDIMDRKIAIKEELSRISSGVESVNEERKKALEAILKELDRADDGMMDWMKNYSRIPSDTISEEVKQKLLQESLNEIELVKARFKVSLHLCDSILTDSLGNLP